MWRCWNCITRPCQLTALYRRTTKAHALEDLVLINDLDAILVGLLAGVVANVGKVRVHHHARGGGVSDIGRPGPVDL
jgi:hypothetical protein